MSRSDIRPRGGPNASEPHFQKSHRNRCRNVGLHREDTTAIQSAAPELDLAIAAGTTFHFWDIQKAIQYYEEITGFPVNKDALGYYGRSWSMRVAIGLQGGLRPFAARLDQRLQVASLGLLAVGTQSLLATAAGF